MDLMRLRALSGRETTSIQDAVRGELKAVWTALPTIVAKDSDGHTVSLKSAVRQIVTQVDGTTKLVEFPPLDTSPVHYPGGGGVSHTHPVKQGDEGVAIFTSMPQDEWHKKGDVQDPIDGRRHHLSDGRYLAGGRSNPRKLDPPPSSSSQQNRSDDGKHVMDVHPQNGLTHASEKKNLVIVGGSDGSGTLHLPDKILKNAPKVLINCIQQSPLPPPGASLANRKQIATVPVGAASAGAQAGGIAGIMSSVLSGGAGAIFANPIAGQAGALSSAITSAAGALGSVSGAGGLLSSLTGSGGLSDALASLSSGVSALAGATTPGAGQYGLGDLLSHAQALAQFFGSAAPPSSVALSTVLAPLQSGSTLSGLTADLDALAAQVVAGTVTPAAAATTVNAWAAQLNALMADSNASIATLNAAAPVMSLALAAASAAASFDPHEQAVAGALGANPALGALTSAVQAVFALTGEDVASAQAFPDASAAQPGATGGL